MFWYFIPDHCLLRCDMSCMQYSPRTKFVFFESILRERIILSYCSVTLSCPTLCDPMDCSTPGLSVPHHLLKFVQVHVHCISDAILWYLFSFCPQSLPASGTFPTSQLFSLGDQNTGTSALASVLPKSIQGWFPLRSTGLISLLSRGLSGFFSSTTVRRHQFFRALPSLRSSSHNCVTAGKTIALTIRTFVFRAMSLLFNTLCLS